MAAESRERLGADLAVATVDHGLRGEAAAEARDVARIAARYGLAHRTLRWRPVGPLGNVPAAAREARYRLLAEAARGFGAQAVVTAHHEDDQIETHLMAAERGEGAGRLAGMRERRDLAPGLVLLRPLLALPKERLEACLRARGIPWASDPTNTDPRYRRARWRERLSAIGPDDRERLMAAIAASARSRDALDRALATRLAEVRVDDAGVVEAPRSLFRPGDDIARALLSRILSAAGGSAAPASGLSILRLTERLSTEEAVVATLGGCRIGADERRVRAVREYGRIGPPSLDLRSGACFDERFDLRADEGRTGRLVPLGALGRGGALDATLPVMLDPKGRPVAAHPRALDRFGPGLRPLALDERVSWRLRRDLPQTDGISQIAAKEPSPVGKDFPADYLPLRRMERRMAAAAARPIEAQSQDER